jgi:hypothetical protein
VPYVDPNTVHNPSTGAVIPAAWGDTVRDDLEFLIDPPACSVYNSTVQAVTTGLTGEELTANSENYDNDSMHSTVSATSRITFQTAGRYFISARVQYATGAGDRRLTQFLFNGATSVNADQRSPTGGAYSTIVSTDCTYVATAGEYVEVHVAQDSGGDLDVTLLEFVAIFQTR